MSISGVRPLIIGARNIGSEVIRRVNGQRWGKINGIIRTDGVYLKDGDREKLRKVDDLRNWRKYCNGSDICFLAIDNKDGGRAARDYMLHLLWRGIPVVTAEKGALSNYFSDFCRFSGMIGASASCGGGSGILRSLVRHKEEIFLGEHGEDGIKEVHAIVNGTLNYIFDELSGGNDLEIAHAGARAKGYAEPGAEDAFETIRNEANGDVPMKSSIVYNWALREDWDEIIRAKTIRTRRLRDRDIERVVEEAEDRRFIVSFRREEVREDKIGGFNKKMGRWYVSAGFKRLSENELYNRHLRIPGVQNTILILDKEGQIRQRYGPGAGPGATVSAMIYDALELTREAVCL